MDILTTVQKNILMPIDSQLNKGNNNVHKL